MVMELLSGEDLEHTIKRLGPLPPELALRIIAQVCLGLQKAHEAGVVHRDIKPANIYLTMRDGGEIVAKLLDFGIAKVKMEELSGEARGLTRTGSMLGTPLYMSPEQALAKKTIDHRTDIWSLGAVLYEALSGTTPHAHCETVGELIMSICSQPARNVQDLGPWIPPQAVAIVHKALAMDPDARFGSADEMFRAIALLLPNGHWLNASMFTPLSPEVRSSRAPAYAMPSGAPPAFAVSRGSSSSFGGTPFAGSGGKTTAGFSQVAEGSTADRPPQTPNRVKVALIAASLMAALGILIGGIALLRGVPRVAAPSAQASVAPTLSAAPSPPVMPAPATPTPDPTSSAGPEAPSAPSKAKPTTTTRPPSKPATPPPSVSPSTAVATPPSTPAPTPPVATAVRPVCKAECVATARACKQRCSDTRSGFSATHACKRDCEVVERDCRAHTGGC